MIYGETRISLGHQLFLDTADMLSFDGFDRGGPETLDLNPV